MRKEVVHHFSRQRLAAGLVFIVILFTCSLVIPRSLLAQWRQLYSFVGGRDALSGGGKSIFFIDSPGSPHIGFLSQNSLPQVLKTTDGGYTWYPVLSDPTISGEISDFSFKDSLTGWLSVHGGAFSEGCYKTTNGGDSWVPLTNIRADAAGIYYNSATKGLFLATWGSASSAKLFVSWDEGGTWQNASTSADLGGYNGFAFNTSDTGIVSNVYFGNSATSNWQRTFDGGKNWAPVIMDSEVWQPLAIPNSKTQFAIADRSGIVMRSDNLWNSWKQLFTFPVASNIDIAIFAGAVSSGCMRGDFTRLFTQVGSGLYMSTDSGVNWKYMCGQPSRYAVFDQRFFIKGSRIYILTNPPRFDGQRGVSSLWMLNLDSLSVIEHSASESFLDGRKQKTLRAGDTVGVLCRLATDSLIRADTVHFTITYDSNVLNILDYSVSSGWKSLNTINEPGKLNVWLLGDSSNKLSPTLQITFNTFLVTSITKVYLDTASLWGHRLNCDCAVTSLPSSDSVEIDFTGCGDPTLLAFMEGKPIFTISCITSNPVDRQIQVQSLPPTARVSAELYNDVGRLILSAADIRNTAIEVSSIPSGSYYLRLISNGYTLIKRVIIQH